MEPLVAAPAVWPSNQRSERYLSEQLFERLQRDLHADDELVHMLASNDPWSQTVAALAAMRLAIFTPHRWSPDERGGDAGKAEDGKRLKAEKHVPVLTALKAILDDPTKPPRLRAAAVLAIGEIERHLVSTKSKLILPMGFVDDLDGEEARVLHGDFCFDPHAFELLGWLSRRDRDLRIAALWALSIVAPLFSTSTVSPICRALSRMLRDESDELEWEAAAKVVAALNKRGREVESALLFRLKAGAGVAGSDIVAALLSIGFDRSEESAVCVALDALLESLEDPRRRWLTVLLTISIPDPQLRFRDSLQAVAAGNDDRAAKLARDILARPRSAAWEETPSGKSGASVGQPTESQLACVSA